MGNWGTKLWFARTNRCNATIPSANSDRQVAGGASSDDPLCCGSQPPRVQTIAPLPNCQLFGSGQTLVATVSGLCGNTFSGVITQR